MLVLLEPLSATAQSAIKWCAVGEAEETKCDKWSINSVEGDDTTIECETGNSVEDCLKMIMVKQKHHKLESSFAPFFNFGLWLTVVPIILQHKKADAVAVDGGEVFTAGKCGLVPAMVEQYDEGRSRKITCRTNPVFYLTVSKWIIFAFLSLTFSPQHNATKMAVINLHLIRFIKMNYVSFQ